MHTMAIAPSPFQHKFNCRLGRRYSRAEQLPQVATQAIADRKPSQKLAAAALALAMSAVLFAGLPAEVRAETRQHGSAESQEYQAG
jgi:hypothetical protein